MGHFKKLRFNVKINQFSLFECQNYRSSNHNVNYYRRWYCSIFLGHHSCYFNITYNFKRETEVC